jgi:hypothetical protein
VKDCTGYHTLRDHLFGSLPLHCSPQDAAQTVAKPERHSLLVIPLVIPHEQKLVLKTILDIKGFIKRNTLHIFFSIVGFEFSTLCFLGRCSSSSSMPKLFLLQLFFKKGLVLLP